MEFFSYETTVQPLLSTEYTFFTNILLNIVYYVMSSAILIFVENYKILREFVREYLKRQIAILNRITGTATYIFLHFSFVWQFGPLTGEKVYIEDIFIFYFNTEKRKEEKKEINTSNKYTRNQYISIYLWKKT